MENTGTIAESKVYPAGVFRSFPRDENILRFDVAMPQAREVEPEEALGECG